GPTVGHFSAAWPMSVPRPPRLLPNLDQLLGGAALAFCWNCWPHWRHWSAVLGVALAAGWDDPCPWDSCCTAGGCLEVGSGLLPLSWTTAPPTSLNRSSTFSLKVCTPFSAPGWPGSSGPAAGLTGSPPA